MGEIHKNLEEDQIEYRSEYSKTIMYFVTKRIIDILGSIIGLLLLSPILIITAIVIKLDSKGPIFFIQERVGKNGEYFNMYKFRSMVIDAEEKLYQLKDKNEMSGPMFKMKNDPRVTRVGSFIRRTSIDELPQLFNVLKGEMSLVGPRPNLPREVIKFTDYQKDKLLAQPGITCYWQVMGRNNIDFEQWIELDVKYVRERSTWVDIKLIFKTVGLLLGDENAA
ncbi:exopolysaccharide biosynthesis polyprenyl glycosylphosphotransferase [Clostridium sporogenes]|uniref:Exopolysaccharide biosynthesis polyprenyl glycosylphosphotransferase n=2 Tax=Clostridium TaxID=1485 RepID=A0A7U4JQM1_CLOSG|nr:exopolysaccharide biosynthesis polyprenyl glycosylphosphotransferase [Clostridium sporogenes]AJD32670.1 exopolysaccharide biosynthesis polyprenyl glycosylphosphotransferase family protein [Clostridium botulinum Prevot_594]AVP60167.1 multidrug MFS transporter [Clostridium botulinum]AKC63488.1 galactosyl transferase CpsE [Clostridium sporogenes]AKJ90657.1 multidrug MFS transporter [Clostridium sporogenes]AVP64036.1 multidrug MFS transporter [Clostridium botulinum]